MKILCITTLACFFTLSSLAQSWGELDEQGGKLYEEGKYIEAQSIWEKALKQAEKEFGKNNKTYASACTDLAIVFEAQGKYREAEPFYKEALQIIGKNLGEDNADYATSCNNLGVLYYFQGRYAEAVPLVKTAKEIRSRILGKEHPDYATSCNDLASIFVIQGKYSEAEPILLETKELRAKVLGKENPDYAFSCHNLGALYHYQGSFIKAEPLYVEAKEIRARVLGLEHPDYISSIKIIASVIQEQGRYSEAELLYKEALAAEAKTLGKQHPDYGSSARSLATLYRKQGKYIEAETLFIEARNISAQALGREHPNYAGSCNSLGLLYRDLGRYDEAEPLFLEAREIYKRALGQKHRYYAGTCGNLASLFKSQGRYSEAESLYKEVLSITGTALGKEHPEYARSCEDLALLYQVLGKYVEAELLSKEALSIRTKVYGNEHPEYASSCNSLGFIYDSQGKYAEAEPLYIEALSIREKVFGNEHPSYAVSCNNLAHLYMDLAKYNEAESLFKKASHIRFSNIKRNFLGLSGNAKEQYLNTINYQFEVNFSFALRAQKPQLNSWLLESNLMTKGLLFFSTNQLRRALEKSNDKGLKENYELWLAKRREIAKAYEMGVQARQKKGITLEDLEKEANELEKSLSTTLAQMGVSAELSPRQRSWQEIKQKLNKREALVEITRFSYYDKKWTDSVLYVALIVKKDSENPEMVVLPHGNKMETKDINYYKNAINARIDDQNSYQAFFEPLRNKLKGINKIYFSSDGVYHQLNLATLQNPKNQRYLGDEFAIQMISTARDFLDLGKKQQSKQFETYRLHLFGNPDFSGKGNQQPIKEDGDRSMVDYALVSRLDKSQRFFNALSGTVSSLPGTKEEVETIETLAKKANINTTSYLGENANEENLKKVANPTILHVATHGFFVAGRGENLSQEDKIFDNPLMRAGLLFAGAEMTINKKEMPNNENGILTAQEAMDLDLQGTDLVVLSACETGLGEIKNGEGVFGLQRALQEAGARSVLMSLWKVDDSATQEMMSLFYENMLLKKQDKRTAFTRAQNEMKKKYKKVYYWGAFVLVGD